MLIRYETNGITTNWENVDRSLVLAMLANPPQTVIVRVKDFYPSSPDSDREVKLDSEIFFALAYEFLLDEERQKTWDRRYRDSHDLEQLELTGHGSLVGGNVVDDFDLKEKHKQVSESISKLSPTYQRRVRLYYYFGFSQEEIAAIDGVRQESVWESLMCARKKLKKILGDYKNTL